MDFFPTLIELGKCAFIPIKQHTGYLVHYKLNVENLKLEVDKLGVKRGDVQDLVDDALRSRGEEMRGEVRDWLNDVDGIKEDVERLEDRVKENKRCFDLGSRYSLGKEAKKKMADAEEMLKQEEKFNPPRVSNPRLPTSIENLQAGEYEACASTKSALEQEVIDALKDENINIIGVYGMGGVGKTNLVEKVGNDAKSEKLFDEVVMVTISQNQDLEKIQGELAEKLGMKLEEKNIEVRAGRLFQRLGAGLLKRIISKQHTKENVEVGVGAVGSQVRSQKQVKKNVKRRAGQLSDGLKQEKKILIILDDMWKKLELTKVGIHCGRSHKGCQIIITTRNKDVCSKMKCQKMIEVQILSEQDSWNLFSEKAGVVETDELKSVAKEVAKECKGLPLAIVTIAGALKGKALPVWRNALTELRDSSSKNIDDVDEELYSRLELSYKYIESEEAKSCFLFCCLFPEDYDIDVRYLMRYLLGERVFNVENLEKARDRTITLVNKLKDSCLLLNGCGEDYVKMHDVLRDMAIRIASGEPGFLVKAGKVLKEWPEKLEQCKRLSLMKSSVTVLPEQPIFPHLQTLLLQQNDALKQFPNDFFEGKNELRVLDLSEIGISSLPPSLPCLSNLKTLCLDGCGSLNDISQLKGLVNLEILSLRGTSIEELPKEIGDFANLKSLDLAGTRRLKRVPRNVISKLSKLEELYMQNSSCSWEVSGSSRDNASFDEMASLPRLTVLYIHVANFKCFSLDFSGPWENLKKFGISSQRDGELWGADGNYMDIKMMWHPICKWVKVLLGKSKDIVLEGVRTAHLLDDEGGGFKDLKSLNLSYCHEIEHITVPPNAFSKLQRLIIFSMDKLEEVFHYEEGIIEEGHPTLKEIKLQFLPSLMSLCKGAIPPNGTLHNVKSLEMQHCNNLRCLFSPILARSLQQLEKLDIRFCFKMEKIISDEEVMVASTSAQSSSSKSSLPPALPFQNLRVLVIEYCRRLKNLLSWNLARGLQHLEYLHLSFCDEIEEIISVEEEEEELVGVHMEELMLRRLEKIKLVGLPRLRSVFYRHNSRGGSHVSLNFPSLQSITVYRCRNLKRLPVGPQLKSIEGEKLWFKGLEWEDKSIIPHLNTIFHPRE
ncbi:putative disease resistance protein At4g27220 [Tasmannia lanceolata]|uniref:putative disease resistance protein At4g27220 n=1 Tax=Tasmannia lanceolata TaxID=3420 RepID=UPI004063B76F